MTEEAVLISGTQCAAVTRCLGDTSVAPQELHVTCPFDH
jgi:hypothetical protein